MTRNEALALIPPGWVECNERAYFVRVDSGADGMVISFGQCDFVYAIPAPKPEPRRVPCGEMVVEFDDDGWPCFKGFWTGPTAEAFANTKWRLDIDAREWVEVLDV